MAPLTRLSETNTVEEVSNPQLACAGLMLVLLYGRSGWFAPVIRATGFNIVFAFPGLCYCALAVVPPSVCAFKLSCSPRTALL